MKNVPLIIVALLLFLLTSCSFESSTPLEIVSAKSLIIMSLWHEVVIIETKSGDIDGVIIEFKPGEKLKKFISDNNLPPGQKFHIKMERHSNYLAGASDHQPYYHIIKEITLLPSGEKFKF